MAKKLKGKWRFNDELTLPSVDLNQQIRFAIPSVIQDEINFTLALSNKPYFFDSIQVYQDGEIEYTSLEIEADFKTYYNSTYYWNVMEAFFKLTNYVASAEILRGLGQVISIVGEQEVSDEFYDWFVANAAIIPPKKLKELVFPGLSDVYTLPWNYEDLENKPDIRTEEEDNIFTIVDSEGNIVAKIDQTGLNIIAINTKTLTINGKSLNDIIDERIRALS